jgi:hypothetical protein
MLDLFGKKMYTIMLGYLKIYHQIKRGAEMRIRIILQITVIALLISQNVCSAGNHHQKNVVLSDNQKIAHFLYNGINRVVLMGESGKRAQASFDHLITYVSRSWEKIETYIGLDQVYVIIHVYSDLINMEVFTTWDIAITPESMTDDMPEVLRRESYGFIFDFTPTILDDADDQFGQMIELIITGVISGHTPAEILPDEEEIQKNATSPKKMKMAI